MSAGIYITRTATFYLANRRYLSRTMDFLDIEYLRSGNEVQKRAYDTLVRHGVMRLLAPYTPLLAGTIPLGIDVEGSDLDIVCGFDNPDEFEVQVRKLFGHYPSFAISREMVGRWDTVVASFAADGFEIELFGQARPVTEQNAYRHMVAEYLILEREGEGFRRRVVELKREGVKTEPAFARLLGLAGDPYEAILNLYEQYMG